MRDHVLSLTVMLTRISKTNCTEVNEHLQCDPSLLECQLLK